MIHESFDQFARAMAQGGTRRGLLRGTLAAGVVTLVGSRTSLARGGQAKQTLCHATGNPARPYHVISVASPAVAAHLAHGDTTYVNCCLDTECAGGQACLDGTCTAVLGAIGDACSRSSNEDYQGTCGDDLYCYDDNKCALRCIREDIDETCIPGRRYCCYNGILAHLSEKGNCVSSEAGEVGTPAHCI